VTRKDWLRWSYNHGVGPVFFSTALAFLTKVGEKSEFTSASEIQVKNQWTTISTEEKLDVISRLEKKRWTNCWHMPLC
jgi:hypothetical protein